MPGPHRQPSGFEALRFALFISVLLSEGCRHDGRQLPLFKLLSPDQTGITFANTITTNDSVNVQTDVFVYNGAGVAVGDIDDDGLPDIFFTGNMVSSRLYWNKGDMRFEDITESAGIGTSTWATGASMVDINDDGYLDIYVCVSGPEWSQGRGRANLLFVNNGDRTFTEAAARYGIADTGFAIHAAFLDHDGDRDLDVFVLNNSPKDFARGAADAHPLGVQSDSPESWNKLYRNNGNGTFTDVSRGAGILRQLGYGLGVAVGDLNRDGWPDIYVSNDVTPNDVLYINNRDGTFTDRAGAWLKHASFAGMGVDIADFNNDGWPDILQVDMMPAALRDRKRMSGHLTYDGRLDLRRRGFRDDHDVNSLQLSAGVTQSGNVIFSDIAQLAGVASTDWSWSALFADFDSDGYKDIFITNGYPKRVNDFDYQMAVFRARRAGDHETALRLLNELHSYEVSNYVFRNDGDLTFTDKTEAWGLDQAGFSYGAAYADLNNDGKLDLVVNNIDAPASIYENVGPCPVRAEPCAGANHYLQVRLQGEHANKRGIGATLILTTAGHKQYVYHSPYRGYMSTMSDRAHFGLGVVTRVDSLEVTWPDRRYQILTDLEVDRVLTVKQSDATREVPGVRCQVSGCIPRRLTPETRPLTFRRLDGARAPKYKHEPGALTDYHVQPLLPYMVSRQGPPLAAGDVSGDGLDDVFLGGSGCCPGRLFIQQEDGRFVEARHQPWTAHKGHDDWGALLFDANGDGRLDLYVASGGYHVAPTSRFLQDRLYVNLGAGTFVWDSLALPKMPGSTASVAAGDFNGDGRLDLFVGGRLVPRNYPYPTRSYVLRNDGGVFTDVTEELAPELVQPGGMITAAIWIDFDSDGRLDLVTAGEWMPLQWFRNERTRFRNVTAAVGLASTRGWWFSLAAGDFNHDGRPDLVAGNLGLNFAYRTSPQSRFGVFALNFTANQTTDIVLTREIGGTDYPFFGRARLGPSIYPVALRSPSYASFATASVEQLFGPTQPRRALHYETDTFATVYLQNNGDGTFGSVPLPHLAQIAPIRGIITHDVDGDGNLDLIVAGNLYDTEPNTPPADAGNGLWLKGDGRGHFAPVAPLESGFLAPGNVTGLALIRTPAGNAVLVANNGDSLRAFLLQRP